MENYIVKKYKADKQKEQEIKKLTVEIMVMEQRICEF